MVAQSRRIAAAGAATPSQSAISAEHLAATQALIGLIGSRDDVPVIQVAGLRGGEGVSTVAQSLARSVSVGMGVGVQYVTFSDAHAPLEGLRSPLVLEANGTDEPALHAGVEQTKLPSHVIRQVISFGFRSVIGPRPGSVRLILVETPPLLTTVEGTAISGQMDGTILVLEADRSTYSAAREAREAVERAGGRILGVVLNKRRYHVPRAIARPLGLPSSRFGGLWWLLTPLLLAAALAAGYLVLRQQGIDPLAPLLPALDMRADAVPGDAPGGSGTDGAD